MYTLYSNNPYLFSCITSVFVNTRCNKTTDSSSKEARDTVAYELMMMLSLICTSPLI